MLSDLQTKQKAGQQARRHQNLQRVAPEHEVRSDASAVRTISGRNSSFRTITTLARALLSDPLRRSEHPLRVL